MAAVKHDRVGLLAAIALATLGLLGMTVPQQARSSQPTVGNRPCDRSPAAERATFQPAARATERGHWQAVVAIGCRP